MVLNQGLIVENNTADNVFSNPQNEYTRKLISSVPIINAID